MDHCYDYCLIMSLTTSHANKYYNISEGTLQLVTVTSSYSPFAEPCAKEAPKRLFPRAPLLPSFTNYFLLFVRKEATRRSPQGVRFQGFL